MTKGPHFPGEVCLALHFLVEQRKDVKVSKFILGCLLGVLGLTVIYKCFKDKLFWLYSTQLNSSILYSTLLYGQSILEQSRIKQSRIKQSRIKQSIVEQSREEQSRVHRTFSSSNIFKCCLAPSPLEVGQSKMTNLFPKMFFFFCCCSFQHLSQLPNQVY